MARFERLMPTILSIGISACSVSPSRPPEIRPAAQKPTQTVTAATPESQPTNKLSAESGANKKALRVRQLLEKIRKDVR